MISKLVCIRGTEYLAKYPVGVLIMIERRLGCKIVELVHKKDEMSFNELSILVRYGLHHLDGTLISDTEYEEFINNIDVTEFSAIVPEILSAFGSSSQSSSSKN